MVFYGFLVLVALGIVTWLVRSPVVKQLLRGRGYDSSQFGNTRLFDHTADKAFYSSGDHETYREPKRQPPPRAE